MGQDWGGERFLVPAPPTFADKILSSSPSPSPNIAPHTHPKRGRSPRGSVPRVILSSLVVRVFGYTFFQMQMYYIVFPKIDGQICN